MLADKSLCCGCSACAAACPKKCITMIPDKKGFLIPSVNEDKCTHCNLCEKACTVITQEIQESKLESETFAVQINDETELKYSTSGGAFTAFAKSVINEGGIVFGVEIDSEFDVHHSYVSQSKELSKFRGSKYVQSNPRDSFVKTKQFLDEGKLVLYSGTPCQISGLLCYLKKEYINLITVDVVCHAAPSPMLFKKYIEYKLVSYKEIHRFRFRSKVRGYDNSTLEFFFKKSGKNKRYNRGSESDEWMRLFLSNDGNRECCRSCQWQAGKRQSDLTIADLFNAQAIEPSLQSKDGYTRVYVNTDKGKKLLEKSKKFAKIQAITLPASSKQRGASAPPRSDSTQYWTDAKEMDSRSFFSKYYPLTIKLRILSSMRVIVYKLGIYSFAKKVVKVIAGGHK